MKVRNLSKDSDKVVAWTDTTFIKFSLSKIMSRMHISLYHIIHATLIIQ
jgi:hypothetical protein